MLFSFIITRCTGDSAKGPVRIDERNQGKFISKTIAIDKVWAGHPGGVALLTDENRQYIAYYNAKRRMVVGDGKTYMLKWETLPTNRDQPYPEPWPEPSQLYLLELE